MALVNKVRMLNLNASKARRIERVTPEVIDDALARLRALLD